MRALIVTNLYPSRERPARGSFVCDQVRELRRLEGVELELFTFETGGSGPYVRGARDLRRRWGAGRFDVIHAHFGLSGPVSLALRGTPHVLTLHGTDVMHPRSRLITFSSLPFIDVVAPVSEVLARELPAALVRGRLEVLPCGVDTERFAPIAREQARRELGLDPGRRYLLFPADPARAEKRFDRARAVAGEMTLLTLGAVDPQAVPLWVNAADAVLVTSERESFGLAVLEALACDVPVLATPVGVAPEVLANMPGTYCREFELGAWRGALEAVLAHDDPRVAGRARAERYSAARMAERVAEVWRRLASGGWPQ